MTSWYNFDKKVNITDDPHSLKGISEIYESNLNEILASRTDSMRNGGFRGLGPHDLVHMIKVLRSWTSSLGSYYGSLSSSSHTRPKEIGSYHYVLGVDCSSSASIAVYLNSLTYIFSDSPSASRPASTIWSSKHQWKITKTTFCCYDAYRNIDVRIEARIPGGVKCYAIDSHGQRLQAPDDWAEIWMSSVLRSLSEDGQIQQPGIRRLDPCLYSELSEKKLKEILPILLSKSTLLGCPSDIQSCSTLYNYLTMNLMSYFKSIGRPDIFVNILLSLSNEKNNFDVLISECYFDSNRQSDAIILLFNKSNTGFISSNFPSIALQCNFLLKQKDYNRAMQLSRLVVGLAPTEFRSWSLLCEAYIGLEQYENALLTLNSCPMLSIQEKDQIRQPSCYKIHYPIRGKYESLNTGDQEHVDDVLQALQSIHLKGTFLIAYDFLCTITKKIGWDNLLSMRASIFIMEEEYNDNEYKNVRGKRLCERWLDHLFMVLYEDLRIMNIWKAEEEMLTRQNLDYKRSPMEWEILGDLALHLYNIQDAKEAYQKVLDGRDSQKVMQSLIEIYIKESKLSHALSILMKMLKFYHARYQTFISTGVPYKLLVRLIRQHGFREVQRALDAFLKSHQEGKESRHLIESILELVQNVKPIGINE